MPQAGRAGLILSIPAEEASLGSPRVGTIHVQAPTPHAPGLGPSTTDPRTMNQNLTALPLEQLRPGVVVNQADHHHA